MNNATILVLLFLVTFSTGTSDVVKKEYAVSPGGTLHLDMGRGNIEVEVTNKDRVFIELERKVKANDRRTEEEILESHEYSFDKRGDDVYGRSRVNQGRLWGLRQRSPIRVRLSVRVPSEYNVVFTNGAGNVEVTDVKGLVEGTTGAGNITLEDINGTVEVTSGAGNIRVSGGIANAVATTGAGNVKIYGLQGEVTATTGTGNIDATILQQPESGARAHFSSGAGNVVVTLADDVGVNVHAKTNLGNAACEFPLEISKEFLSRTFSGSVNGGGAELEMHAGVGNVKLKRL